MVPVAVISADQCELAVKPVCAAELQRLAQARNAYLEAPGWVGSTHPTSELSDGVAYFSMQFSLGEALPLLPEALESSRVTT
jgi:hypothetical protein